MEACGTAHYWGRVAQEHGHQVTLLPPNYVRPFVRRNKTGTVPMPRRWWTHPRGAPRRADQAGGATGPGRARVREQWMDERINALRGLLGEHGLNLKTAVQAVPALLESATALPAAMRRVLASVHGRSGRWRTASPSSTATSWPPPTRSARCCKPCPVSGWGRPPWSARSVTSMRSVAGASLRAGSGFLTPREYSSGGHRRLGHISKRGDRYLRCMLIHGGRAVVLAAARRRRTGQPLACTGGRGARPVPLQPGHRRGGQQARPVGLGRLDPRHRVRRRVTAPATTTAEGSNAWHLEPTDTARGRFLAGARDAVSCSGPRCATVMVARRRTSPPQRPNIGPQSVRPLVSSFPFPSALGRWKRNSSHTQGGCT